MITIEELQAQVHKTALEHGWWPMGEPTAYNMEKPDEINYDKVNIPEKLALMHSELSEALEWYRGGFMLDKASTITEDNKPDGFWIELADCIIRILDLAGAYKIDMEALLKEKHEYNKTRPYRHGGKKA